MNKFCMLLACLCVLALAAVEPIPAFAPNERVLFQGDSITDGNRGRSADPNHILGHGYAFIIAARHGAGFAEFPTSLEAASACRDAAIAVMMGAPNLIRGGSHSGNVAAKDLAQMDLLDILSSDYVPSALLSAALMLVVSSGPATVFELPHPVNTAPHAIKNTAKSFIYHSHLY